MKVAFLDPIRNLEITCDSPEELARRLADTLPQNSSVRFSQHPFPLDPGFLKQLQVHFEREKLPSRHEFSCSIDPASLTAESGEILSLLNFREIEIPLPIARPPLEALTQLFDVSRHFHFKLLLKLSGEAASVDDRTLSQLYFFLRGHLGRFALQFPQGFFENIRVDAAFRKLAGFSLDVHIGRNYDARLQEQFYLILYEYLRLTFSPRVKTVLEINPFGQLSYFRDFNRISLPWKVTLSDLHQGQLNLEHLQSLDKTFDAIVLFQALPSMRDPQKELLMLQNFARPTTEWVAVQFNTCSFPMLQQLASNEFHTATLDSPYWPLLRLQGRRSLEELFRFSGIAFQWIPTRVRIEELRPLKNQLDPLMQAELPEDWDRFLDDADVMAWSGSGALQAEEAPEGFEGFVSEGFL